MSREEVAKILEDFLEGNGGDFDWDDFVSGGPLADDYLEKIRVRSAQLWTEFPPENPAEYCSGDGRQVLRDYVKQLRTPSAGGS